MTVGEFLTATNQALRGIDDDPPLFGSEEADYWLGTLNRKINELYRNSRVLFDTIYSETAPNEVGTVATTGTTALTGTGTKFTDYRVGDKLLVDGETVRTIATIVSDTSLTVGVAFSNTASGKTFTRTTVIDDGVTEYSLHRSFIAPSDNVFILDSSNYKTTYKVVKPREHSDTIRQVFISGNNPQVLTFTSDIASTDSVVGGSLLVPGYYMPNDLEAESDELTLPDPYWGVMSVASEIAFGDITYEDKAESLNTKANNLYSQMVRANRRGTYRNPKQIPYETYRIRSTEVS